jgi:hypothetical protein
MSGKIITYAGFFLLTAGSILFMTGCSLSSTYINKEYKNPFIEASTDEEIAERILLIGDAGQQSADVREPVLEALELQASRIPERTTVLFLGDNIYPYGLDEPDHKLRSISERRLMEQIKVVENSGAEGIFIPGNHDWDKGQKGGWNKIITQQEFIRDRGNERVRMLPVAGCPGPEVIDYGRVRLIIIDTQWWLHKHEKPNRQNSNCKYATEDEVLQGLDEALRTAEGRFCIVATHHPLDTHGPHGGHFNWKDHLFPLLNFNDYLWIPFPVIGSLYPLSRILGITRQDITNPTYKGMIKRFEEVLSKHDNWTIASGHEHSLQVLKGVRNSFYLISGFGTSIHNSNITVGENTVYADDEQGFMQVDILQNGRARLSVFQVDKESGSWIEVFTLWLNGDVHS